MKRFPDDIKAMTSGRAQVMTIINVTPDSFFAGSRTTESDRIRSRVLEAAAEGADILDVGAYSSRPGADDVTPEDELSRLRPAMDIIRKELPEMPVSIDTFRASVAEAVLREYGRIIINDISAGGLDPRIIAAAARQNLPYIAMHMRGTPQNMQTLSSYPDITGDVMDYFRDKIDELRRAGINDIIIDPGFGFAKTTEQNYTLLRNMHWLTEFRLPVLAGISRKSMIYKTLGITPAEALNGTTALHWECLRQGASILRVHDTAEAVQVVKLWEAFSG